MSGSRASSRADGLAPTDPVAVREALAKVTASDAFRGAPQLASFLTCIVGMALEGRGSEIKGYTIATQALGRGPDFDPQTDPIVRVEAMRLRRALEAYYGEAGACDPLRIVIPRGSYVPLFEAVAPPEPAALDQGADEPAPVAVEPPAPDPAPRPAVRPKPPGAQAAPPPSRLPWRFATVLAIVAFTTAGLASLPLRPAPAAPSPDTGLFKPRLAVAVMGDEGGAEAARLREDVVDALAEFGEVAVVEKPADLAGTTGAYVLSLRPVSREGVSLAHVRLTAAQGGRVIWAREVALEPGEDGLTPARRIAARIAQPYGVVLSDLRAAGGRDPALRCVVDTFDYWRRPSRETHLAARDCLRAAVERAPRGALAQAHLSRITLEEARAGYNAEPDPVGRAWSEAREAVMLQPESARAHQAVMNVLFHKGDVDGALAAGRRAVELSPGDADLRANVGSRLVQAGRFQDGAAQMARAIAGSPAPPAWYQFPLFVAAVMTGDEAAARNAAARIDPSEFAMGHLARALAAKQAGRMAEAQSEMTAFLERRPDMRRELRRELVLRLGHGPTVERFEAELAALMPQDIKAGRPPG
ncbi:hypothetical protein [Salinarimonas soli]|uniref:Uncharacterized protein n=1 Tax=Salinarimonas soli TaxID=1638099 RepID=A0A5B2V807_9HYPH|nr:hypothetical protein [Salinarimonas soli]KAA2235101.1 hypothetical protein F0L46_21265 [Salinarimonas soli]